jgi:hypothetical protein
MCRPNINQNIRGFHTENDLQNNSDEDSNPVRGGQVYDRDPHLPTLPEESSSDGIHRKSGLSCFISYSWFIQ